MPCYLSCRAITQIKDFLRDMNHSLLRNSWQASLKFEPIRLSTGTCRRTCTRTNMQTLSVLSFLTSDSVLSKCLFDTPHLQEANFQLSRIPDTFSGSYWICWEPTVSFLWRKWHDNLIALSAKTCPCLIKQFWEGLCKRGISSTQSLCWVW